MNISKGADIAQTAIIHDDDILSERNDLTIGDNSIVGNNVIIGKNVVIKNNCIIEDHVMLGDNVYIDNNTIIRSDVKIGNNSTVGANCIIGEYQMDFFKDRKYHQHELEIGNNALIRSGSIIYSGSTIGSDFQTGHQVTIREAADIGNHVSVGTLSDIQGKCKIGNFVRLHSNVHIGQLSVIDDCVWIFPYVILTNDPTPPSDHMLGVHIHSFAIVATGAVVLPGVEIMGDSLVGAGTVVNKDVAQYSVVVGNPGKEKGDVRSIKNKVTGELAYPWRYHYNSNMPWENMGFDKWYESIDDDTRRVLFG